LKKNRIFKSQVSDLNYFCGLFDGLENLKQVIRSKKSRLKINIINITKQKIIKIVGMGTNTVSSDTDAGLSIDWVSSPAGVLTSNWAGKLLVRELVVELVAELIVELDAELIVELDAELVVELVAELIVELDAELVVELVAELVAELVVELVVVVFSTLSPSKG
jgi:hypothetical protein